LLIAYDTSEIWQVIVGPFENNRTSRARRKITLGVGALRGLSKLTYFEGFG